MAKKTKVGEKRKDDQCFGTCPHCDQMCWATMKKDLYIYAGSMGPVRASQFKCTKCGRRYGFLLN